MSNNFSSSESGVSVAGLAHATLQRLASQSAACKLWSVLTTTAVLVLAFNGTGQVLLWGATPLILLALADAGYAAQARRVAEFGRRAASGKDPGKSGEFLQFQAAGWGFEGALSGLMGFLSFTVWPFYLALAGVVIGLGSSTMLSVPKPNPSAPIRTPTGFVPQSGPYATQPARPFPNSTKTAPLRPGLPPDGTAPNFPPTPLNRPRTPALPRSAVTPGSPPTPSAPAPQQTSPQPPPTAAPQSAPAPQPGPAVPPPVPTPAPAPPSAPANPGAPPTAAPPK